jgi:hypothetical protein
VSLYACTLAVEILYVSAAAAGVLEVDEALRILRADEASGLILGHGSSTIVRRSLHRYVH